MANLSYQDKEFLKVYLKMDSGYVLDFTNDSYRSFIFNELRINIYDDKYNIEGDSKAKRTRALWKKESDHIVGKLIKAFVEYYKARRISEPEYFNAAESIEQGCIKIYQRLLDPNISTHLNAITPSYDDIDFSRLANSIKVNIENNEPELALDRLHTFYTKFVRDLCKKNQIAFTQSESLNAIYGKYIKFLDKYKVIESEMTKSILKYSINLLENYNDVRNNRSFAHDNKLLNYKESLYLFDTLARLKDFIDYIQEKVENKQKEEEKLKYDSSTDELSF